MVVSLLGMRRCGGARSGDESSLPLRELRRPRAASAGKVSDRGSGAASSKGPRRRGARSGRLRGQGSLGALHIGREGGRLVDGHLGQDLAVDLDPGLAETVDKSRIGQAVLAHRRVEPLDPERAEGALLVLAVAVGVLQALLDRLLGDADRVLAAALEAFRLRENLLVLGVGGDAPFDAGHDSKSFKISGIRERSLLQPFGRKYFFTL